MQHSYKVVTIGGIEIYVNWSWLLAIAFMTWSLGDYYAIQFKDWGSGTAYLVGAVSAVLLFVTVLIHELAHSFTARARGLPVKTIYLFIFGGVSNLSREPETPRTELLVALAGPLASLLLSGLFFGLYLVSGWAPSEVGAVFAYLSVINIILAVFNLIPGFPLDGGRVLRAVIWSRTGSLQRATRIAGRVGNAIGWLMMLAGLVQAVVLGQVGSGIWLVFIGWFLRTSASAGQRQVEMESVLTTVSVRTVMDAIPTTVSPETPVATVMTRQLLNALQHAVPVTAYDGDLLGLITPSDLLQAPEQERTLLPISRIMTPTSALLTVSPDATLRDALQLLSEHDYGQLPVMRDDRLVGMLDRGHVTQYLHVRQQLDAMMRRTQNDEDPAPRAG